MPHDLQFESVRKVRKSGKTESLLIFDNLNLTIPAGQHLAVVGRSGIGKSTLLYLANRLEEPDSGRVLFGGTPLTGLEVTEHRRQVAMVMQNACMFDGDVMDNVTYGDRIRRIPADTYRAMELLEMVGIEAALAHRPGTDLSVGQKHRITLARTLYLEPKVLMLDETTASMDPKLAVMVLENLVERSKKTGMTLIHVTHEVTKIRFAERVVLLEHGSIAEDSDPQTFLDQPKTAEAREFLGK